MSRQRIQINIVPLRNDAAKNIFRKNYDRMHYILLVQTQLAFELNFRLTILVVEKGERTDLCPFSDSRNERKRESLYVIYKVRHCDKKRPECLSLENKLFWYINLILIARAIKLKEKRYLLLSPSQEVHKPKKVIITRKLSNFNWAN